MVFVSVLFFFLALYGSMMLALLAGSAAAYLCRSVLAWVPLTLIFSVAFQFVYLTLLNMVISFNRVEEGTEPFWERYWNDVQEHGDFGWKYGLLLGVIGWVWCLKRTSDFIAAREERKSMMTDAD